MNSKTLITCIKQLILSAIVLCLACSSWANEPEVQDYIVTLKAEARSEQKLYELEQYAQLIGAEVKRSFNAFGIAEISANDAQFRQLAALDIVADIHAEQVFVDQLNESLPMAHIDTLHAANITGDSQIIAVLDSGIDTSHPFFSDRVIDEACFSDTSTGHTTLCPNGTDQQFGSGAACNDALYSCNHGTHVSGIALGANSSLSGVAPSAQLVAIQISTLREIEDGIFVTQANEGTILAALNWLVEQNYSNLVAINISQAIEEGRSITKETGFCDSDNGLALVIDILRQNGTVTTISSGNFGYKDAVSFPACISSAVTVGRTTNTAASWDSNASNFGPQVDLLAPGQSIYSSFVYGDYGNLTGTSMAAPHVAGIFAQLRGAFPNASIDTIEAVLKSTGSDYYQEGAAQAFPEVDATAAYLALAGIPIDIFEAESGIITQGAVESNHAGYTGSGYVNLENVAGSSVTFNVNVVEAGYYYFKVRYANGTALPRYADIAVNGSTVGTLTFYPIADWAIWVHFEIEDYLNAGSNTITITSTDAPGAANIDSITLVPTEIENNDDEAPPFSEDSPRSARIFLKKWIQNFKARRSGSGIFENH